MVKKNCLVAAGSGSGSSPDFRALETPVVFEGASLEELLVQLHIPPTPPQSMGVGDGADQVVVIYLMSFVYSSRKQLSRKSQGLWSVQPEPRACRSTGSGSGSSPGPWQFPYCPEFYSTHLEDCFCTS